MGCINGKNQPIQDSRQNQPTTQTFALKDKQAGKPQRHIDNIDEFKISTNQLVMEKQGKINKDYTLLNPPLGQGAFGKVRKAIHKASQMVRAVKIINKAKTLKSDQEKLIHEVEVLKNLDHPNILKVYEFYQDQGFFYIVTELCTGGELFDQIISEGSFSEKKAAEIFRQTLQAVNYLHKNRIVHRDLKPENILFESTKAGSLLKIIDFGTSELLEPKQKLTQQLGTAYYIAPEVVQKSYTEKCDVWSCGVILYILLCGHPPFTGNSNEQIMEKIIKEKVHFDADEWQYISNEGKQFIMRMLEKDPKRRVSAEDALKDQWFKKFAKQQEVNIPKLRKSLANMSSFRQGKKLQEATYLFFVNYLASKDEKQELLKAFQSLDTNGDGKLSRDELIQGYEKICESKELAIQEVNKIMEAIGKTHGQEIDYSEWVMATIDKVNLLSKQKLETAFKMFDTDGSGTISIDEIKKIFGGAGNVSDEVWVQLIDQIDDNGDGQISFQEFSNMMQQFIDNNNLNSNEM